MTTYEKNVVDSIFGQRDQIDLCDGGTHDWVSIGGRKCPLDLTDNCSQAVYRCAGCGRWDYGEPGGPGSLDCKSRCSFAALPRQQRRKVLSQRQKGYKTLPASAPHPDRDVRDIRYHTVKPGETSTVDEDFSDIPF